MAAWRHTASSSTPSILAWVSMRGRCTSSCLAVPLYVPAPSAPCNRRRRASMREKICVVCGAWYYPEKQAWWVVRGSIRKLGSCDAEGRSEEHTSELQSHSDLVCRL